VISLNGRGFSHADRHHLDGGLYSLLKNSLWEGFVSGHDFSRADRRFIFVIPSGLQPARNLLFRLFQQTV